MYAKKAGKPIGDKMSRVVNINNLETVFQGMPDNVYQQARYA
jgi:hypothetical protein